MKKIMISAVAAIAALASCQKEQPIGGGLFSKEAEVSFTVNVPSQVETKGIAEADNVDIVYYQIWSTPADPSKEAVLLYPTKDMNKDCADAVVARNTQTKKMEATISVTLVKDQTYTFIFWAQDKEFTGYTTKDLRNVEVDYSKFGANNDACDAFYAYEQIEVKGPIETIITLTRPFAQLNFGASAMECDLGKLKLGNTKVTVSKLSKVFNTASGLGDDTKVAENVEFMASGLATTAESLVTETGSYHWVKMDYMLMQEDKDNVTVEASFDVGIDGIDKPVTHRLTDVPIKKNHRTNIVGDLFTTNAKLTIIVDERFVDEEGNLNPDLTPADVLKNTLAKGGEFTLLEDMTINESLVVGKGVKAVINLNGKTITNQKDNKSTDVIVVDEEAELEINGPGNITAVSGNDGYPVFAWGKVTINGGVITSGVDEDGNANAGVYVKGKGAAYIKGGEYHSEGIFTLNKYDSHRAQTVIEVTGGTFYDWNPADNEAEGKGTDFVAEGYESVETAAGSNVWVVKPVKK